MTFAAAAPAWATVSGISLGPWQVPDKNIPAVGLSTGLSLGWASVKKSLVSMLAVSIVARALADLSGSMAGANTTIGVIEGTIDTYRNVEPGQNVEMQRRQMDDAWTRRYDENLGKRFALVETCYDMQPGTPVDE